MTTTISSATLTVTLTESLTLNGNDRGSTNSRTVASIAHCDTRIATVTTTEEILIKFGTSASSGQFNKDKVRYIRISNKDDTNHCTLVFRNTDNTNANEVAILLDKGHSFILPVDAAGGTDATLKSSTSALSVSAGMTLADMVDITAVAAASTVMLEVFVASIA